MQANASPVGRSAVTLTISSPGGTGTPECGGGPLHGGLVLLGRLEVDVDDPSLTCEVHLSVIAWDGWLACESVLVTARPDAAPVTGTTLRAARLASYLDQLRSELEQTRGGALVVRVTRRAPGVVAYGLADELSQWRALETGQRQRPGLLTPAIVAACYRDVMAGDDEKLKRRATAEVARRLSASRGHISRVLTAARRQGLLREAFPGRAGEKLQA
jgi:hypothetical protein